MGNTLQHNQEGLEPLPQGRQCYSVDLPTVEYQEAWDLQRSLVAARKNGIMPRDIVLFLEHQPVFTLGRRGGLDNLAVPLDFLEKEGIPIIHVERGGDITFHGPGQLVVYPIIDLRAAGLGVADYVTALEEVMIRTAADFQVRAERNRKNRGVWVGNNKLGSIGVAIRRGVSFHGLALNVTTSLAPFSWIHPCGLSDIGMASLGHELSREVSMDQVRASARHNLESVFAVHLVIKSLAELKEFMQETGSPSVYTKDIPHS
ncbi:MAG: lipoyl(octanoyl) transferase LipB [Deltaproteobacteria bacterium]|nr:MAG: lipoyl(octanoyl) transferase LipB [Deltaproteobacteria bacterium]